MTTAAPPLPDAQLDEMFAALANSTRRAILARLAEGEATVSELAAPFDMSLPAVSKHIRVLERAGLISQGRRAQLRPCKLETASLAAVSDWAEHYRNLWEERFDQMGNYLDQLDKRDTKQTTNQDKDTEQ